MLRPTFILHNAKFLTLDDARPAAAAMAVLGDRIGFIGDSPQALGLAGPETQRVDLAGRTVVPGFIDSHIHLMWFGSSLLREANLVGAGSVDEVLLRLSDVGGRTEGWIRGHGFDQSKLAERRFPTRAELDRVSRDRPVVISRVCGHAGVANSCAINQLTPEERSAGDAEAGLYTEGSLWAFYRRIPPLTEEQMEQAILKAADVLLDTGITAVQTLLDTPEQLIGYSRLHRAGKLPIRIVAIPPWSAVEDLHRLGLRTGFGDEWLKIGHAKLFGDGSLGAQTALLRSPYADKPDTLGLRIYDPEDLKRRVLEAQQKGFSMAIHAIGDQAVREVLDAIEHALDHEGRDNTYHRHRIEHVSLCPPDCVQRLARRKIVATLQPQFVTSDTWTPDRIGPARVPWAYPFRTLLRAGVPVTLSSDCPVEWPSASEAIASAVGRHEWSPADNEGLTPLEAVRAYCAGSAYAGFVDHQQGTLTPGKLADFVVLDRDPTSLSAGEIRQVKAEQVWVGGRRVR